MYIYEKCPWYVYQIQSVQDWINSYYELGYRLISLVETKEELYAAFEKIERKEITI